MNEDAIRFVSEIVKPWETFNQELSRPFSMNPGINDFITRANALALAIKHLPESAKKIKPKNLIKESLAYSIISDLADSKKHDAAKRSRVARGKREGGCSGQGARDAEGENDFRRDSLQDGSERQAGGCQRRHMHAVPRRQSGNHA